jgi:anti-sigma-K factor RskA
VWENIKAAIHSGEQQAAPMLSEAAPPSPPSPEPPVEPVAEPVATPAVAAAPPPAVDTSNVIQLPDRARRWRNIASVATALAAALVGMLAVQVYRPELLPDALRPKPRIQTVEVKTPAPQPVPSAQYVALLQRDGGSPAFILTVDAATKNFTVRKVGADAEPGKSFELWLISDKLPQPRSLGVIGGSDFTARPVLAGFDAGTINGATYAVTVEQTGGSPTGQPTSAPIYTGKLIETVPAR